jgi:hypothetical protein
MLKPFHREHRAITRKVHLKATLGLELLDHPDRSLVLELRLHRRPWLERLWAAVDGQGVVPASAHMQPSVPAARVGTSSSVYGACDNVIIAS